jgi:hypothetical protein
MATEPSAQPDLDALPVAPSRGDAPSVFRTRADAFVAALVSFRTQLVAVADWITSTAAEVYDNAVEAAASASSASGDAAAAAISETNAAASAAAAGDASPVDLSSSNIGDLLQVIDVGSGVKGLAMSAQRLENSAAFTGTTPSLDIAADQYHHGALTGNTTFTFDVSGFGALSGNVVFFALEVTQDSTPRTITFPASVEWDKGIAPDAPDADETAIYAFTTRDGGTTWRGVQSGRAFS